MIKFLISIVTVAVIAAAGYFGLFSKKAEAPTSTLSEQQIVILPKTGDPKIDNVITALEQEALAEATVAGEADASASTVTSDSADLNNLDQSYDSKF